MYLRLPCLGNEVMFQKYKVKHTINCKFGKVNVQINHFTKKPLNGMFKEGTHDPEKNNVIYQFKCHCDSVYIGRTFQRLNL